MRIISLHFDDSSQYKEDFSHTAIMLLDNFPHDQLTLHIHTYTVD